MPPWLIHGAAIAGRALAGAVGCVCFYLAFFVYEDEQGRWQNRIEELWVTIHDRARYTDTVSTAVLGKIAQTLVALSNSVFGKRLYSWRMLSVSTNLSLAGAGIEALIYIWFTPDFFERQTYSILSLIMTIACGVMVFFSMRYRKWVPIVTLIPFWALLSYLLWEAIQVQHSKNHMMASVFTTLRHILIVVLMTVVFSLISDAVTIIIVRRLFLYISNTFSSLGILKCGTALLLIFFAILPGPYLILDSMSDIGPHKHNDAFWGKYTVALLNVTTACYLLIPALMLIGILVHRVIWPVLGRVVYSFSTNKILANKKVLTTVGTMALTISLNLEHVGAKELLKLLS